MNKLYLYKTDVCEVLTRFVLILVVCGVVTACNENDFSDLSAATSVAENLVANGNTGPGSDSQDNTSTDNIFDVPVADPVVLPLIAGQHIEVGTVTITNTENAIIVVYETFDGWGITETHVDVALDYSGLHTTGSGNPIPGRFDQQTSHPQPVNMVVHTIEDLQWTSGTPIYVATHAVVTSQQQGTETAWAGDLDFPGRNWATYFTYTTQQIVQDDRGRLEFSQAVYTTYEMGRGRTYVLEIKVVRVDGSSGTISANYDIVGGNAIFFGDDPENADYTMSSPTGTVEFTDGDTSEKIITILILDDNEYEVPNETIELELSASCCLGDQSTATVEIVDDEELS